MKNIFSKGLYIQGIKRLQTAGIGSLVSFVAINALAAFAQSREKLAFENPYITGGMILPYGALIIPISFLFIAVSFSFLDKRRDSDFYHGLPQKRICVYLSLLASVLTWIVGTLLISFATNTMLWKCFGHDVELACIPTVFAGLTASAFVISGVAIVCRIISGTGVSFIFYSAGSFLSPRLLGYIFTTHLSEMNRSIMISNTPLICFEYQQSAFFPFFASFDNSMTFYSRPLLISWLFIEAIIFFALGAWLYHKRNSELAGQRIGHEKVHFIFRSLAVLPLLFWQYIMWDEITIIVVISTISLLAHFLIDLLVSKSAKKSGS